MCVCVCVCVEGFHIAFACLIIGLLFCFVGFIEANSGGKKTRGAVPEPGVVVTAKVCELFCVMMILVLSSQAFCFLET